jgi:hypothetical protein
MKIENNIRSKYISSLLGLWALLITQYAIADGGPPMVTDDPGTVPLGHFEINMATLINRSHADTLTQLPLLDMNYGATEHLQLKIETPFYIDHGGDTNATGMGNLLMGAKWHFWDGGEENWNIATYPQIELKPLNSQSVNKGLADPGTNVLLPLEFQKSFGVMDVTADVGRWKRVAELNSSIMGGVVLGHKLNDDDQIMFELHAERADHAGGSQLLANIGTHLEVNKTLTVLLSAGRDLHNDLSPFNTFFCYVGLQLHLAGPGHE